MVSTVVGILARARHLSAKEVGGSSPSVVPNRKITLVPDPGRLDLNQPQDHVRIALVRLPKRREPIDRPSLDPDQPLAPIVAARAARSSACRDGRWLACEFRSSAPPFRRHAIASHRTCMAMDLSRTAALQVETGRRGCLRLCPLSAHSLPLWNRTGNWS